MSTSLRLCVWSVRTLRHPPTHPFFCRSSATSCDTLENINKTPSEHSNIHHVHFIQTKLPSKNFKKCWKEVALSQRNKRTWKMTVSGIHETISPPPPLQNKVYTSTKYFWLKDSDSKCEYLGIVVGHFFPPSFTRACTTLNCLRLRFPCTAHRFASNRQFYKGSEGRTYLEPPMQPCDRLAPTLSIVPRHSSRVEKLRTTSKIFQACS